jgi:hypothetical protein
MPTNNWNPFAKNDPPVTTPNPDAAAGDGKNVAAPPEKTPAELLAESLRSGLEPVMAKLTEVSTRLDTVEQATKRPARDATEGAPPSRVSVFDDEDAAIAQRMAPLFQRQLETEARMTYNEVKSEVTAKGYGEVFEKFGAQIEQTLEGSPLVGPDNKLCRGDKTYIRNVITMVIGAEAVKAGLKFNGRDRGFFIEGAGGSADGGVGTGPVNDGLNDAQRKFATKHGLSNDQMKASVAKLKFVN